MALSDYLLISLILFTLLLYPLLRKAIALLEIFVKKYVQNTSLPPIKQQVDISQPLSNLKLLAYERIILLIERIKPDSLIPRTLSGTTTNKEFRGVLINEVRKEFEYNLSQQLYLSESAWTIVVNFKDNMVTLINSAYTNCQPENPASELAQKVLESYIASDLPADRILKAIKADISI